MEFQHINRTDAEKVFVTVTNDPVAADLLEPGKVVEWTATTTAANAGIYVNLVDVAVNVTTGIAAKVAGVVDSTISTGKIGRLQIYGVDTVRASASLASSRLVVASSINATNLGHVTEASQSTLTAPEYDGAAVGWTVDDSPNATNASVFLSCF
jgi:hypothetical protein